VVARAGTKDNQGISYIVSKGRRCSRVTLSAVYGFSKVSCTESAASWAAEIVELVVAFSEERSIFCADGCDDN
jgi:hypothetical protein